MIGNAPDEEHVDPHGECRNHIRGLELQIQTMAELGKAREKQFAKAREERDGLKSAIMPNDGHVTTPELMRWIADRLVEVHGENENVDYVLTLRARADRLDRAVLGHDASCGFMLYGPPAACTCRLGEPK